MKFDRGEIRRQRARAKRPTAKPRQQHVAVRARIAVEIATVGSGRQVVSTDLILGRRETQRPTR